MVEIKLKELTAADLSHINTKYFDIPYAELSNSQKLDLYLPDEAFWPAPLIIYFHGGAFAFGDKRGGDLVPILRGIERGYAVASAEYRKSGEALFPAMVYDAKAAVRFLRANAGEYHLDSGRIAAWGASSGGWLVSMLGVTEGNPAFDDPALGCAGFSSEVQAVVDWCAPAGNFLAMDEAFKNSGKGEASHNDPGSPESAFLGVGITRAPELCRLACPCTYASPLSSPFLIVHGENDVLVPAEQSLAFFEALREAGGERHKIHIAEGKSHHGLDPWFEEPCVSDMCFDFLDSVLYEDKQL